MTGFCSCKTGIHAIHGNNLGAVLETRVQYRHRDRRECGGAVKVIACIEDSVVIEKILTHVNEKSVEKAASAGPGLLPEVRAPPQAGLFG